jgi:hypothetical protein
MDDILSFDFEQFKLSITDDKRDDYEKFKKGELYAGFYEGEDAYGCTEYGYYFFYKDQLYYQSSMDALKKSENILAVPKFFSANKLEEFLKIDEVLEFIKKKNSEGYLYRAGLYSTVFYSFLEMKIFNVSRDKSDLKEEYIVSLLSLIDELPKMEMNFITQEKYEEKCREKEEEIRIRKSFRGRKTPPRRRRRRKKSS